MEVAELLPLVQSITNEKQLTELLQVALEKGRTSYYPLLNKITTPEYQEQIIQTIANKKIVALYSQITKWSPNTMSPDRAKIILAAGYSNYYAPLQQWFKEATTKIKDQTKEELMLPILEYKRDLFYGIIIDWQEAIKNKAKQIATLILEHDISSLYPVIKKLYEKKLIAGTKKNLIELLEEKKILELQEVLDGLKKQS